MHQQPWIRYCLLQPTLPFCATLKIHGLMEGSSNIKSHLLVNIVNGIDFFFFVFCRSQVRVTTQRGTA
uniref:WD repeat domain-containing protein 83 n=1 Tax=Rhizophora mucronata TaxID=61149 RepID=A0A2P2JWG2_RHIMU